MKVTTGMIAKYKGLECKIVDVLALSNRATVTLKHWDGAHSIEYVVKNTDLEAVKVNDQWVIPTK